ncbi:MAG: hypothetical protein M3285_05015 [Actinomycetota bacterium]|nr:hypothetical protein [Actinomycetota bacterium]
MKRTYALVASIVALALVAPSASATETETEHRKRFTETFVDELPCVGEATITTTSNSIFHSTENKKGFHVTFTSTGKFVADPTDPALPTYRGRFTTWFGENSKEEVENGTFTFSVTGKGEDGSRIRFHIVGHFTVNKNGLQVEFEKPKCSAP